MAVIEVESLPVLDLVSVVSIVDDALHEREVDRLTDVRLRVFVRGLETL